MKLESKPIFNSALHSASIELHLRMDDDDNLVEIAQLAEYLHEAAQEWIEAES